MSPTLRAALALAAVALCALILPLGIAALAALALLAATAVDAWTVRTQPVVRREFPHVVSRGVPTAVQIEAAVPGARAVRLRQALPPSLVLDPPEATNRLESRLTARVRGRHHLPELGVRAEGRLGLGAWSRSAGAGGEVHVYPDLITARRLAIAARAGRLLEIRRRARGPIGLGTEFESVREWLPDDDVRHVNWAATTRLGRPMTNQYRLEQAREVMLLLDAGRLMAAPLGDRTRLDAAIDALAAVALAVDELGDHCGAIAFDERIRHALRPGRAAGAMVVRALFDLQPRLVDSNYEQAFHLLAGGKRALALVFTDLFDDAAAGSLIEAVPVLARRHAVVVASATDPDLDQLMRREPRAESDVIGVAAALGLLDARTRAVTQLRHRGAHVIEASASGLPAACVNAYLRAKETLRL